MEKPVYDAPADVQPLKVGDQVPESTLVDIKGKNQDFKALLSRKPTVLIFYRGGWCPYCNTQMGQLVEIEPELSKLGFQILAVTPDKPASLKASLDKHKINYDLLSDPEMKLTQRFGLAYHMGDAMVQKLKEYGNDIEKATGNSLHELPVPAAYVLDKKAVIHFVYFNPDFKVRVDPDELLQAARKIAGPR